jgi:hypothetical protein
MTSFSNSFQLSPCTEGQRSQAQKKIRKTCLATGGLSKPQSPVVREGMLDIEIILVMEDGDLLITGRLPVWLLVLIFIAIW